VACIFRVALRFSFCHGWKLFCPGGPLSLATADIHGSTGANFTVTISAGTILSAYLEVANQPVLALTIGKSLQEVTVTSLPAGHSLLRLDLVWSPGEKNAIVSVGTVTIGMVKNAAAQSTLTAGDTPGYVELWGE